MKLALIFLPMRLEKNWTVLKAQDDEIGIMPPLSLAYVAAVAEKAGHEVVLIDAVAEGLSFEEIIERIRSFSPHLLGFTITTYGLHQNLDWIKKIKERTKLPIVVGGWHLSLYPQETMAHPEIDYAVTGEADSTLPHFLKALEDDGDLRGVNGLAFRQGEEVIVNSPADTLPDIDTTPFPARHLLKNNRYYNVLVKRRNFTVMLSARGCPFRCIFCDLKTKKFRMRSPENFVDEIESCYKDFGIRSIDIYDSSFTVNKKRVHAICDEIRRRKLDIDWTVRTRADCVDKELLQAMSKAGCTTLMYGIESGDPQVLKTLRKDTSLQYVRDVVGWTKHFGMKSLGFFIVGSPGDTLETIDRTIDFACALDLDYVQFTKMTPFPNTEIYDMYMKEYGEDYWRNFTLDQSCEKELPLVGTSITEKEAFGYIKKAYLRFYFRPSYIWKALIRMGSFMELKNNIKAAIGILLSKQHLVDST